MGLSVRCLAVPASVRAPGCGSLSSPPLPEPFPELVQSGSLAFGQHTATRFRVLDCGALIGAAPSCARAACGFKSRLCCGVWASQEMGQLEA